MKNMLLGLIISALLGSAFSMSEISWGTDIVAAKTEAQASDKHILLSFSGSDWCANCMRLEKTLFESTLFQQYALEHFVLLNADFPARKKNRLSEAQTQHNEQLAEKYNRAGLFPMVLILNAEGEVVGKLSHPKERAEDYMEQLKKMAGS